MLMDHHERFQCKTNAEWSTSMIWYIFHFFGGAGLGISSYYAIPILYISLMAFFSQVPFPDWNLRDIGSVGGFVVFASFMSWLHIRTTDKFDREREAANRRELNFQRIIMNMIEKGYDPPSSIDPDAPKVRLT
jgi:hypothetical protein